MIHVEIAVVIGLLVWNSVLLSRGVAAKYVTIRLDKIEEHLTKIRQQQTNTFYLLRGALGEIIGSERTDAVIEFSNHAIAELDRIRNEDNSLGNL